MNEQTRIKISALIDDELDADEFARLGPEIAGSGGLRELYGRYQLIGDALRGEKVDPRYMQVADGVRARLADDPTVLAPRRRSWAGPWLKPVAGAAVAASVLAAAVLLLPPVVGPQLPQQVAAFKHSAGGGGYAGGGGTRWDLGKPAVQSKLNGYLVNHRNRAPSANMQGMIPYASFVAYDQER